MPTITWSRIFSSLPERRSHPKKGHLAIFNTTADDSGMYACEASNPIGRATMITQLVVLVLPKFIARPPETLKATTGEIVSVNCSAVGDRTLSITWSRHYAELPDRRATVDSGGLLTITQLTPMDAGKYTCTASSVGGAIKISTDMKIIVLTRK